MEICGELIPRVGVLIVKNSTDSEFHLRKQVTPGIIGLNAIKRCKEVLHKAMNSSYVQHIDTPLGISASKCMSA